MMQTPNATPAPEPASAAPAASGSGGLALMSRTGGVYIPPAKLRAMQAAITDKSSAEYQRMSWEALKKSINGHINKANTSNLKNIIPELINENLIRGRGLYCRSIMKSQAAALPFTTVYAAMTAVLNTKFPQLGELLVARLILQFRRAYRRNDKLACLAGTRFLAHLVNHKVAHEIVVLQILTLLLERPTDDAVEIAVGLMREAGAFLTEHQPRAVAAVFDRFRSILHEAKLSVRTQYMIEVLFQVRRDNFKDNPAVIDDLDLVEDDDQVTHYLSLDDDDELDVQEAANVFKVDPNFLENEAKYAQIKRDILGSDDNDSGSDGGSGSDSGDESDSEDSDADEPAANNNRVAAAAASGDGSVIDETGFDLMALRKTIYLTIMSSLDYEECIHKLMRLSIGSHEHAKVVVDMIIDCCSQERTYKKFYGLMAERLCKINRLWADLFAAAFAEKYEIAHRYENTALRSIARAFAHLLATDAIPWTVLECVVLTHETTSASSRIFIMVLFQEMKQEMGITRLLARLTDDPFLKPSFAGMFPRDNPAHLRYAINFWTSIKLSILTEEMRECLKNAPPPQRPAMTRHSSPSDSSSSSSSSSSSGSDSSSGSSSSGSASSSDSDSDSEDDRRRTCVRAAPSWFAIPASAWRSSRLAFASAPPSRLGLATPAGWAAPQFSVASSSGPPPAPNAKPIPARERPLNQPQTGRSPSPAVPVPPPSPVPVVVPLALAVPLPLAATWAPRQPLAVAR
ncbi:pre-mRNA-splicing factor cwc22 [Blastocladiella emersonii ATCC 22665]|nr:pre-mRNA-splicing factor cwc22 [Blastocladiella emersonii ATCC 22665]